MNNSLFNLENYQFSSLGVIYLIVAGLLMFLGLLNVYKTENSYHSKTLFFLTGSISIWLFCSSLNFFSLDSQVAFYWSNASFIGVPLIAPANYLFTMSILYPAKNVNGKTLIFLSLGIAFLIAQVFFHFMFDDVYHYSWGYYSKFKQPNITVFSLFYTTVILYCTKELFTNYKKAKKWTKLKRKRLDILILAFITGNLGSVNFLPGMGLDIYPIGIFFILMFIVVLIYAIEKYQLVELNFFVANKIINIINDALMVCDSEGSIYYFNKATNDLSHYAKKELEDKNIDEIIITNQSNPDKDNLIQLLAKNQHELKLEACVKTKDKSLLPISLSCSPILGKNRVIKGWILIAHDIRDYIESIDQLSYLSNHDYLTGIFDGKKFEKMDLILAYISFCNHTNLLYFKVITEFFRLGVDPNTLIYDRKSLLVFTCSNSKHSTEGKLEYLKILESTGLVKPESYSKACELYIINHSVIDQLVVNKLLELSKTKHEVSVKEVSAEDSSRRISTKSNETRQNSAVIEQQLPPRKKWYHRLISRLFRSTDVSNKQANQQRYYSSTGIMMNGMNSNGTNSAEPASMYPPQFEYTQLYADGNQQQKEVNSSGYVYQPI